MTFKFCGERRSNGAEWMSIRGPRKGGPQPLRGKEEQGSGADVRHSRTEQSGLCDDADGRNEAKFGTTRRRERFRRDGREGFYKGVRKSWRKHWTITAA